MRSKRLYHSLVSFYGLFKAVTNGWKKAGTDAGGNSNLKKKIGIFVTDHSDTVKNLAKKLSEFKSLYEKNKTFKRCVDYLGK